MEAEFRTTGQEDGSVVPDNWRSEGLVALRPLWLSGAVPTPPAPTAACKRMPASLQTIDTACDVP